MADISKIDTIDVETGARGVFDIMDAVARENIGNLPDLKTKEKGNLVSTVNELKDELPPLIVTVAVSQDPVTTEVTYTADVSTADIKAAVGQNRVVLCRLGNRQLLLDTTSTTAVAFGTLFKHTHHRVTIYENGTVKYETFKLAMTDELKPAATDEIYFDITADGIISLKPEYRGACSSTSYTYGLSDNGKNRNGTRNKELPEEIVIPESVNGIAVTALAVAMFMFNRRVKRLVLPECVTEIPRNFCAEANNLEEVKGTENVTTMGANAFYRTNIRKAYFPSLATFTDGSQFMGCANLVVADLGNVLKNAGAAIPKKCFSACEKLESLRNAGGITSIGEQGLYLTYRLNNLSFLPNLTNIGTHGLFLSRADYDWDNLTGCTFGEMSTSNDVNTYDYSGCAFTPCNTPMRSTFEQNNPLWADKNIGNCANTYASGCATVAAAMVYSALMGVDLESPEEFVTAVGNANPNLLNVDIADWVIGTDPNGEKDTTWEELRQWLDAVGLQAEYVSSASPENVQSVYDALANGALVIARTVGDNAYTNHTVVIHGINANGELLVVNSSSSARSIGIYEAATYAMPVQNMMRDAAGAAATNDVEDHFVIVTKK